MEAKLTSCSNRTGGTLQKVMQEIPEPAQVPLHIVVKGTVLAEAPMEHLPPFLPKDPGRMEALAAALYLDGHALLACLPESKLLHRIYSPSAIVCALQIILY